MERNNKDQGRNRDKKNMQRIHETQIWFSEKINRERFQDGG
jgi:hypothetical protein